MRLLAFSSLALGFPAAMQTLTEKFSSNPKWAELWLRTVGLLGGEPEMRLIHDAGQAEPAELIESRIQQFLIGHKGKEDG